MKIKHFLLFIFFLLFITPLLQAKPLTFYIQPQLEFAFTKNDEYILSPSGKRLVSYLEWGAEPLFLAGLEMGVSLKGFSLWFYGDMALPLSCGKMYDSDWNYSGTKTTYSIHQNNAILNYQLSSGFSYSFSTDSFKFGPGLSFLYNYDSFNAQNGYGWYGGEDYSKNGLDNSWDSEFARKAKKLYPIDLKRTNLYYFLDLAVAFYPRNSFNLGLVFSLAIYNRTFTYDYHYGRPGTLNDFSMKEIQECFFQRFKTALNLNWQFHQNFCLAINVNWLYGDLIKGLLYDDDELVSQQSGNAINSLHIKTGICWTFSKKS